MSDAMSSQKPSTMPASDRPGRAPREVMQKPARIERPAPSAVFVAVGLAGLLVGALIFSAGVGTYDGEPAMVIGGLIAAVGIVSLCIGAYRIAQALDLIAAERWNSTIKS